MSITQNSKIRRITDSTLVVGADIAKKVHVARASDVRGVELGKPLTFDNTRHGFGRLLTWIQSLMVDHSCDNVVFGVEPTGHYWIGLTPADWTHTPDIELFRSFSSGLCSGP
ncbi:IS110 family transposase [Alicyclobacillus kakegawensis]|uniref:IS110 family transposase n=1 Tax=Alicyclobacillus kakegawensis TaxID=392012 RepID=UPI000835DF92